MSNFIQLHLLTSYPPSNLNRDDLGRPKTAIMGGKTRLRVSSQSLKRAWRTSSIFADAMKGHIGTRTKTMGVEVYEALKSKGVAEKNAKEWARQIAEVFGKGKKANAANPLDELEIEQLAHFSPEEKTAIDALVDKLAATKAAPSDDDLKLLRENHTAADIAMFGRMLASSPAFNTEAAVQVAHALTVHDVAVEDDYFTAVDDLNKGDEDMGLPTLARQNLAQAYSIFTSVSTVICYWKTWVTRRLPIRPSRHWLRPPPKYRQMVSRTVLHPVRMLHTSWPRRVSSSPVLSPYHF